MNKCIMSGNVTRDPQISMSKSGKQIVNFSIAVKQDYKTDGEYKSDFFNCVAFGGTAEYIGNYIVKGNKVLICGKMQNNNWEKDGVKHYGDKIVVENCEGLTPKKSHSDQGDSMEGFGSQVAFDEEIPF